MIIVMSSPNPGLQALARGLGEARVEAVDVTDMRSVRGLVERVRPKAVVSTVWRDWRSAEADPEAAFRYDGEAAINMAAAALEFEASACLLSVADVFGQAGGPFDESATPAPASEYADAARRAEVFFLRAMRDRGLVVRSGPWFETIAHEVQHGGPHPSGVEIQPVGAEALGRFVAELLGRGATGIVHAVPAKPPRAAEAVYREAARRMGRPVGPPAVDLPLARSPILRSRSEPSLVEVGADASAPTTAGAAPAAEPSPEAPDSALLARRGPVELRRYAGPAGQAVELSPRGRMASLWLRDGKGLVERPDAEDQLLGPQRTLTVDGSYALRFAPATHFELYVLLAPGSDDHAAPPRDPAPPDGPGGG